MRQKGLLVEDTDVLGSFGVTIPRWEIRKKHWAIITPSNSIYTLRGQLPYHLDTIARWKKRVKAHTFRELFSFLRKPKVFKTECFFVSDIFQTNYYHWFCEILPRLLYFRHTFPDIPLLLPTQLKEKQFILDSLNLFNIRPEWLKMSNGGVLRKLYYIKTTPNKREPQPFALNLIRTKLCVVGTKQVHRKIYISRAKAGYRRLLNEYDIFLALDDMGFELLYLEDMTLKAQVKCFSEAQIIVAPHGAGLTNMIFSQKGTVVVELLTGKNRNPTVYRDLALICEHQHRSITSEDDVNNFSDFNISKENLVIELSKVQWT